MSITAQLMKYDQTLVSLIAWTPFWAQWPQCWNLVLVNSNQGNREVSWDSVKHPCGLPVDSMSYVTASSHGSSSDCASACWEVFKKRFQYVSVTKQEYCDLELFLSSLWKERTINQYILLKWHFTQPNPSKQYPLSPGTLNMNNVLWFLSLAVKWSEDVRAQIWPQVGSVL